MLKSSLISQPELLFESSEWIVLNKPAGWLSIAGRKAPSDRPGGQGHPEERPVLLDWVRAKYSDAYVVHRLDRETSGVILFAKGAEAHKKANLWFQNRETKKLYCCLASGEPKQPTFLIREPIEGAPSSTQVDVKEKFSASFYAWVRPVTGRRHQIRIHLASVGTPILGDSFYLGPKSVIFSQGVLPVPRVALHAMSLELPSGEKFQAPIPQDFQGWLDKLRA